MARARAAVLLVAVAGCHAHVALPLAPTPAAPFAERARFFRMYRPSAVTPGPRGLSVDGLSLNDGSRVVYPEDVLAMVGPGSSLEEPVRRAERSWALARGFTWGGIALLLPGGLLATRSVDPDGGDPDGVWAGFGLVLAGLIASTVGILVFMPSAQRARAASYEGMDRALRERMNLCVEGDLVRDCAAPPAPPPAAR